MQSLNQVEVKNKVVLVRGDLDVSKLKRDSFEDYRLKAMLPTLNYLLTEKQATVVLIGHRDRPKGQVVESLRMRPVADWLQTQGLPCDYVDKTVCSQKIISQHPHTIILLENIRFDPREEKNDPSLAQEWASMADLYVNECFSTSHRKHASIVAITQFLPAVPGFRLEEVVETLSPMRDNPARPLVFIMGGAKTKTKIPLVKKISAFADTILLGGKLIFEQSLEGIPKVRFAADARRIDDIGPKTEALFADYLNKAKTIVWNGPMGRFEEEEYAQGTHKIADAILQQAKQGKKVVVGGGDTLTALEQFGLLTRFESLQTVFLSTGGGAMLEFLAQGTLPGLRALGYQHVNNC